MRDVDHEVAGTDVATRPGVPELLARLVAEHETMRDETDLAVVEEFPHLPEQADVGVRHHLIDATFLRVLNRLRGTPEDETAGTAHRAFGAAAAAAGVPLHELTAAYRLGSRVAWARLRRVAGELGIDADTAMALAQAQLACVDELTADSVQGYSEAVDTAHRRRVRDQQDRLERLLAAQPGAVPATWGDGPVAAAVVHGGIDQLDLPAELVAGTAEGTTVVVGPLGAIAAGLRGHDAVRGSAGDAAALASSLRRARRLAALVASGTIARDGLVSWENELAALVVHAAPDEVIALVRRHLEPLRDGAPERERWLLDTLQAWLDHPGQPLAIARRLHLHPQTVRYRLRRLRERLGDRLDSPEARFEMALALRHGPRTRPPRR